MDRGYYASTPPHSNPATQYRTPSPHFDPAAFRHPTNSPRFSPQSRFRSPNQHQHHPYYSSPYRYQRGSPGNQSFGPNTSYSSSSESSNAGSFIQSPYDKFQNTPRGGGKIKGVNKGSAVDSSPSHNIGQYALPSMLEDPWKKLERKKTQ